MRNNTDGTRTQVRELLARVEFLHFAKLGFCDARIQRAYRDLVPLIPLTIPVEQRSSWLDIREEWYEAGRRIATLNLTANWATSTQCPKWLLAAVTSQQEIGTSHFKNRLPPAEIIIPRHMLPSLTAKRRTLRKQYQPPTHKGFNPTSFLADLGL